MLTKLITNAIQYSINILVYKKRLENYQPWPTLNKKFCFKNLRVVYYRIHPLVKADGATGRVLMPAGFPALLPGPSPAVVEFKQSSSVRPPLISRPQPCSRRNFSFQAAHRNRSNPSLVIHNFPSTYISSLSSFSPFSAWKTVEYAAGKVGTVPAARFPASRACFRAHSHAFRFDKELRIALMTNWR